MAEHERCRGAAALFDVSHMTDRRRHRSRGRLDGAGPLVPADLRPLAPSQIKYSFFTNEPAASRTTS